MKRLLLSFLMVVIGLSAFSQSPSRLISLQPSYPISIGGSTADGIAFESNILSVGDIVLDSLPQYEIRYIDTQTVKYSEDGYGFYVKADSLHSPNVVYSCEVTNPPQGEIMFDEMTGRFKYYPAADDYKRFVVSFTATNGTESISEDVEFCPMPRTVSEAEIFNSKGTMPDAGDYTTIAETSKPVYMNNKDRTAYSISISGKDVIFDNAVHNKLWSLSGREDIYELNIYAERLIIRSALCFPQTNITIYAKEIIFEDKGSEYASINTTPMPIETLTDETGNNGANAGEVKLYVKEFKGNMAIRFILNGAKGQSTNRNGTPGKGGNGGTIYSTIDISNYCDFTRGSGGVKYDVAPDGSTNAGPIIEYGATGNEGRFVLTNNPYAYLHPYYVAAVIRHANDAFINNYIEYALQTCREYRTLINEYINTSSNDNGGHDEGSHDWGDVLGCKRSNFDCDETEAIVPTGLDWGETLVSSDEDIERKFELQSDLTEINAMLFRLEQGLDYFGNPAGWVPLLSFEVYLKNYDNEISRAIPTLYMYYWMNHIDRTLQEKVRASQEAATQTEQEIGSNIELLNSLTLEVPVLEDEAEEINRMIVDLTQRIDALQNQLMAQATRNVKKRNRWKNLWNIGKAIISAIPVIGNITNTANSVVNTVTSFTNTVTALNATSATVSNPDFFSTINTGISNIVTAVDQNFSAIKDSYEKVEKTANSFKEKMDNLQNVISNCTAPNSEIQEEYNKLIANSVEWRNMMEEVNELNTRKTELLNHMNEVFTNMTTTISELHNDALALDAFRRDAFTGNSKRDLNAMLYLEKMEQRAKNRLLLYDYYLRKAYEYRLLEPYAGEEFNLNGMFERLETLGMALDSVVNVSAYNTLGSIYRDRVSDMTQRIIDGIGQEKEALLTYKLTKEQINGINSGNTIALDFYEKISSLRNKDNVRIVDIDIYYLGKQIEENGDVSSGMMELTFTHSGISKYRKDGKIFWFNHIPKSLPRQSAPNPHTWILGCDAITGEIIPHKPSAASESLLYSLVGSDKIMLFSRPSAWSDISLSKRVDYDGGDILIDSLILKITYNYTERNKVMYNIDITTKDGLLPYIACSDEDISKRSGGRGKLFRTFKSSSQPVIFTAMDRYESYYFKNWTDQTGKIVSEEPELTVKNRQKDQYYIANYEWCPIILNVPDTIEVGCEGGTYTVHISDAGQSCVVMNWHVSDSLSSWVHLNGVVEGVEDGDFTFAYDKNEGYLSRIDSLEIFIPETGMKSKKLYIVQAFDPDKIESVVGDNDMISIYPNPMKENVKIEGEDLLSVCIYSITGKEMYRQSIGGSNAATINVSGLPNGVYIISVNMRNGMISKKLLKTN